MMTKSIRYYIYILQVIGTYVMYFNKNYIKNNLYSMCVPLKKINNKGTLTFLKN